MDELLAGAVAAEELRRLPTFRRLRRAKVVVLVDESTGKVTPLRGAKAWHDVAAGRAAEFDAERFVVVRVSDPGDKLFAVVAELLARS